MKKIDYFTRMRCIVMLLIIGSTYGVLYAQNVEIKDAGDNILMRVEDEGTTGSIYLNSGAAPTVTTNKLYNAGGVLNWSGSSISPLWSLNGSDIYYNSGKVGIGVSAPTSNLYVSGNEGVVFTGTFGNGSIPVQGAGTRMIWYPKKAAFRAGNAVGTEWDDSQIGDYSIALGNDVEASALGTVALGLQNSAEYQGSITIGTNCQAQGVYSVAMGFNNHTNGSHSLALNFDTEANGDYSVAMGHSTTASGLNSLAFGHGITASGNYSVAIGLADLTGTTVSQSNTLAIMGGKVGIGSQSPAADLDVNGIDGVLFTGSASVGTIPAEGGGTRMMWYPKRAAFRAGSVISVQWDDVNIGDYSAAFGYASKASGNYSFAAGSGTLATAIGTVAFGLNTTAGGSYSVALGRDADALGSNSFAFGNDLVASGNYSIIFGLDDLSGADVSQDNTMAIMGGKVAIGSVAPSRKFEVHDNINSYVTLIKNSEGDIGDGLRITLQPTNPDSDNRYVDFMRTGGSQYAGWICGNGSGGVVFSTTSDRRLKMNIVDYQGGLENVSKIKVRQYEMLSAPGKEEVGFIAQELLEIYPQAVSGDPNGNVEEEPMGIDYGRITPLLVKAIQEQQKMIEELQSEIELLKVNQNVVENKRN